MKTNSQKKLAKLYPWGLIAVLFSVSALADIKGDITAKYITSGITLAKAEALNAKMLLSREQRVKARREAKQLLFNAVVESTRDAQTAFRAAVTSDPDLKLGLKAYEEDTKTLQKLSGDALKKAAEELKRKYRPLFTKIFSKGKIDERRYRSKAENAVRRAATHPAFKGRRYKLVWTEYLSFYLEWINYEPSNLHFQPETLEIVLTAPFPNVQEEGVDASTDGENGNYTAKSATYFVGGGNTIAGLGHFVDLPGGYDDLRVTAALPDTDYAATAIAFGGASGAGASSTIEIFKDNEIVCEETFDHAYVLAIVGWIASESGIDTYNITCDTNAPSNDTEVVLSFYGEAESWAGGLADCFGRVTASPRDLKLRLTP